MFLYQVKNTNWKQANTVLRKPHSRTENLNILTFSNTYVTWLQYGTFASVTEKRIRITEQKTPLQQHEKIL
jgi:hypothetical protein